MLFLFLSGFSFGQDPTATPEHVLPTATSSTAPATASASAAPASMAGVPKRSEPRLGSPASLPAIGENVEAIKSYARGDYQQAADMLAQAYRAGQAGIQDRLILARAYLHLGKADDALAVLKNVLETDKENPDANSLSGQLLLKAGQNDDALKYLEHAYRLKPDPVTAGALGRCQYTLGNLPKAKTFLATALKEDIRDPSNSFLLGRIHLERGSGLLAEKYLLMAQEAGLESVELHLLLGQAYMLQEKPLGPVMLKRLAGAGERLQSRSTAIGDLDPKRGTTRLGTPPQPGDIVDACVVLEAVAGESGLYKVCTRYCGLYEGYQLLKSDQQHPEGLFMAASGWFAAGNTDLTGQYLKPLMEKPPIPRRAWELQSRLLVAREDFAGLETTLVAGQADKAFDARAVADFLCRAAAVLRANGRRDEALAMLAKAETAQPASETVLRSLATLYAATGKDKQALQYYGRIVELFPDAADIDEFRNAAKVLQEKTGVQQ